MTQTSSRPAAFLFAAIVAIALWLPTLSVPPATAATAATVELV
jgi:hypothetical protein